MPLTSLAVDALGVVTISLVSLLLLFGLFCILYTFYFRSRIRSSGFAPLGYFNGPWIVRIAFIAFSICWGFGEVVRLSFFRQEGRVFHSLGNQWQEDMCKLYILSNLGFTEPCLLITICFLLRASLKWKGSEILNQNWNIKTTGYVLLYCLPLFLFHLIVVMVVPRFQHGKSSLLRSLPERFTSTYLSLTVSGQPVIACTYPVLCTLLHGLFAVVLTTYLLLLGRRMVVSVINKGLQRRVYILIFVVSSFLPLRALLLGFSVLARHGHFLFEALAFTGFFVLLICVVVSIVMLVYYPISDSLALHRGPLRLRGAEEGIRGGERRSCTSTEEYTDSLSLIAANQGNVFETSTTTTTTSLGRNSDASTKRGSISFRTMIKDEASSTSGGIYEEEMTTFSPGFRLVSSSPGSPATPPHMMILSSSS